VHLSTRLGVKTKEWRFVATRSEANLPKLSKRQHQNVARLNSGRRVRGCDSSGCPTLFGAGSDSREEAARVAAVDESTLVEARGTPDNTKIDVDAGQDHQKNERQPIQKGAPTGRWLSADGGGLVELAAEVTRSPGSMA
jgi:hypothetical protein